MWPIGRSDFHCSPTEIINFITTGTHNRWMSCLFCRVSCLALWLTASLGWCSTFGQIWITVAVWFQYIQHFSLWLNTKWHPGWKVWSGMPLLVQWHMSHSLLLSGGMLLVFIEPLSSGRCCLMLVNHYWLSLQYAHLMPRDFFAWQTFWLYSRESTGGMINGSLPFSVPASHYNHTAC